MNDLVRIADIVIHPENILYISVESNPESKEQPWDSWVVKIALKTGSALIAEVGDRSKCLRTMRKMTFFK